MTDKLRRRYAQMFHDLINSGVHRKQALLQVRDSIRALNPALPNSRTQVYAWCRKFGISTR